MHNLKYVFKPFEKITLLEREISLRMSCKPACCARKIENQKVGYSDDLMFSFFFLPVQGRVIILGFNSSNFGVCVILVLALSANVTLNHLILMKNTETQRAW